MGSVLIVVANPSWQVGCALDVVAVGASVGPFAQQRLDEALGLSIGARGVRASAVVPNPAAHAGVSESMRAVARAVVGKQRLDLDALRGEPSAGVAHEACAAAAGLVWQDLSVGEAGEVINRDVHELPSGLLSAAGCSHAGDAMPRLAEAAELLDIQVQQLASVAPLVAAGRDRWLEACHRTQTAARQDRTDCRPRDAEVRADNSCGLAKGAQVDHDISPFWRQRVGPVMGLGGPITQALATTIGVAPKPLVRRAPADPGRAGRLSGRPALLDASNEEISTGWRGAGILMDVHPGYSLSGLIGWHQSASRD